MKKITSTLAILMMATALWANEPVQPAVEKRSSDTPYDTVMADSLNKFIHQNNIDTTNLSYGSLGEPDFEDTNFVAIAGKKEVSPSFNQKNIHKSIVLNPFVNKHTFSYESVDEKGESIKLSAAMYWLSSYPSTRDIVLLCPYTHCKNAECASVSDGIATGIEQLSMMDNYWLIIPDGEGFGDSSDRTQLYLNHELWARHEVDCLKAAWDERTKLIQKGESNYPNVRSDWHTIIAGSSQGGGTALATLRYMETTKDEDGSMLDEKYKVSFANICCGPYDPVLTVTTYFKEWYRLTYPCVIPMVLKSMIQSYPDIMGDYKEEDFYTPEYLAIKKQVDDALASKTKGADDINAIFFANFSHSQTLQSEGPVAGNGGTWVTEFLLPDVIDLSSDKAQRLIQCLQRNNVLDGKWVPKHYIRLRGSDEDAVVPYANTKKLLEILKKGNYVSKIGDNSHAWTCTLWVTTDELTSKEF